MNSASGGANVWRWLLVAALSAGGGCGGSSASPDATGTQSASFMGIARSTGATSCTADSHPITAAEGTVSVTLTQTTPRVSLLVQLCAPSATDHSRDCTINRQSIDVGQTLSGTLRGGAAQVLALNTLNCGGGAPPEPAPITYTVSVSYAR